MRLMNGIDPEKPSQYHDGPIVSAQENQKSLQSDYFGEVNELGV